MKRRQRVLVNCATKYLPNGGTILTGARSRVYDIVHFYVGGKVRTTSGDVFTVKPHDNKKEAEWIVNEKLSA